MPETDPPESHEQLTIPEGQISICTRDALCQADVDQHEPDCPVEAELKRTFGF